MRRVPRRTVMPRRRSLAMRYARPLPPMPPYLDIIIFVHQASPVSLSAQDCRIRRRIALEAASCRCRASSARSGSCPAADCAPDSPRHTSSSPGVSGRPSPSPADERTGERLPMSDRSTTGRDPSPFQANSPYLRGRGIPTTATCRLPLSASSREFCGQRCCCASRATTAKPPPDWKHHPSPGG